MHITLRQFDFMDEAVLKVPRKDLATFMAATVVVCVGSCLLFVISLALELEGEGSRASGPYDSTRDHLPASNTSPSHPPLTSGHSPPRHQRSNHRRIADMGGGQPQSSMSATYPKKAGLPVGKQITKLYEERLRMFTSNGQYASSSLLS